VTKHIYSLLILCLFSLIWGNTFAQSCNTFRECDNFGRVSRDAGDLSKAQSYYQKACFIEAAKSLVNLRNNSCKAVTTISGELDNYASAYSFFDKSCNDGKDAGCFHLALLENDRGNLQLAIEMMKPLCDRNYIIHKNVHSSGCTEIGTIVNGVEITEENYKQRINQYIHHGSCYFGNEVYIQQAVNKQGRLHICS